MSEKTTLLSEAETEFTRFKRAIAGLDEAQMRQVWLGTWSARDIVAHISGWHREMGPALERIARGERPVAEGVSYEDVDAWNGRFAEAKKAASTADILKELDASHAAFMRAAAAVPDERVRARQDRPQDRGPQQPASLSGASRADRGLAQGRLVAPTRWSVLVVPALLYFLSYFHRVAPVVVAGDLMAAFAVSAATLGALSAIYPYCFAAMALPGGSLADFLGPRRTLSLGGLSMSAGSVLFGLAPGFGVAFAGRLLVGLGASVILIAGLRLAAEWFADRGVRHRLGRGPERGLDRRARGHDAARPARRADRLAPRLRHHRRGHRAAGRRVLPHRARPPGAPAGRRATARTRSRACARSSRGSRACSSIPVRGRWASSRPASTEASPPSWASGACRT